MSERKCEKGKCFESRGVDKSGKDFVFYSNWDGKFLRNSK
jgi:hypothetical protein